MFIKVIEKVHCLPPQKGAVAQYSGFNSICTRTKPGRTPSVGLKVFLDISYRNGKNRIQIRSL